LPDPMNALRLGSPVKFQDRWLGKLTSLDIDEDWEVLNATVTRRFLLWRSAAKLPFALAAEWSDDFVAFDCTSVQAFRHDMPPVAAPARPVSAATPVSAPGAKFAGALVSRTDRRARELLIAHGIVGQKRRVPVGQVTFEGKTLTPAVQAEKLPPYVDDSTLHRHVRRALAADRLLTPDDRHAMAVDISAGAVILTGNVRNRSAAERAALVARAVEGVVDVRDDLVDDPQLEQAVGAALDRAGLQRVAAVYARSNLGDVTLFGEAHSPAAVDEIIRAVSQLKGVGKVESRLQVQPPAPAGAAPVPAR